MELVSQCECFARSLGMEICRARLCSTPKLTYMFLATDLSHQALSRKLVAALNQGAKVYISRLGMLGVGQRGPVGCHARNFKRAAPCCAGLSIRQGPPVLENSSFRGSRLRCRQAHATADRADSVGVHFCEVPCYSCEN